MRLWIGHGRITSPTFSDADLAHYVCCLDGLSVVLYDNVLSQCMCLGVVQMQIQTQGMTCRRLTIVVIF